MQHKLHKSLIAFSTIILITLTTWSGIAQAQTVKNPHSEAQLLSSVDTISPNETFWALLHLKLDPHWHSYWKNPGDSGATMQLQWGLPEGFTEGDIHWQAPERIVVSDLVNYGYENNAYYLTPITAPDNIQNQEDFTIYLTADWLVCEEECVPENGNFSVKLTGTESTHGKGSEHASLIHRLLAQMPKPLSGEASYEVDNNKLQLNLSQTNLSLEYIHDIYFFPAEESVIKTQIQNEFHIEDGVLQLTLPRDFKMPPNVLTGMLEIQTDPEDPAQYFQIEAKQKNLLSSVEAGGHIFFWEAILFALLGGIILNAMPCVFPILSLKALALAQQANKEKMHVRIHGLCYTMGVLASFAVLAAVLAILQSGGQMLGWGYQMQLPWFVALMVYLLFILGLNLSGFFEIYTPWASVGSELTMGNHARNHFFTGVLATLVATPCTAPFMGTAVGYALTQPSWISTSVIMSLGLGFALPYLLISWSPSLRTWLPKPGAWMDTLKQLLAFPLYASCIWLIWVFAQQTDVNATAVLLLSLLMITFFVWLWPRLNLQHRFSKTIVFVIMGSLSLYPLTAIPEHANINQNTQPQLAEHAEAFSPKRLQELLDANEPVFVNATAAWCITCKVNERVALSTNSVINIFKGNGIHYLVADWTHADASITAYLNQFDRRGVPLYVFYPPNAEPVVLPQLLTPDIVKKVMLSHDYKSI